MTGGKWGDSAGKPDPKQARAQGFEGLFLYFGTPQFSKNCTPAYYAAVRAAGLAAIGVVEHDAHDAELGAAAGASYAQAALADMAAQGAAGIPLGVTADEHLTAGQIPIAIAFQAAASRLIRAAGRQAMGYGFMEFIHALRPAGLVDIEWQAGALSLVDALTHFWQDNTGTELIGSVTVDRDWKRKEYDVTTPADYASAVVAALIAFRDGNNRNIFDMGGQAVATGFTNQATLAALASALSADEVALLAAFKATQVAAPTDPTAVATALEAAGLPTQIITALLAVLAKAAPATPTTTGGTAP
jgi:hypothetical protein